MVKQGKIVVGMIACASVALLLMFAAAVVVPKMVDSKTVRNKLRSQVKETTGFEIDFKHLRLGLLPRAHVTIEKAETAIPGLRAAAAALTIHAKILPLFLGKLQITRLRLDSAQLDYTLPLKPDTKKISMQPISPYDLGKKMESFFSTLPEFDIPNLDYQVVDSRVNLFDKGRKVLTLNAVHAHMEGPPDGRTIAIDGESNLWQQISAKAQINTRTFEGSGQIKMTHFQPQDLAAYLFPVDLFQVTEAPADLTIDFETGGPGQLQAAMHWAIPYVNLRYAEQHLNIKKAHINAAFKIDKDATTLSLTELAVDDPRLNVSGRLVFTQSPSHVSLQAEGTHIDIAAIRRLALVLAAKNDTAMIFFDILRGGTVPLITLKAQGDTLSDLGNLDNADIKVKDANICGISMSGTATLSSGVLAFGLETSAMDQELDKTLKCLDTDGIKADGTYRLNGKFQGRGKIENLLDTASGHVAFSVPDGGRIYHDLVLLDVLKFFNALERLDGRVNVADMGSKGFGYHSFRVKAKLQDGKLLFEQAVLRGQPMTITAAGEHDVQNGKIDMDLLVAPLVTADRFFEHIPLIGGSLETLDAFPLGVSGALDNIHIYPLAPSAIEHELIELMNNSIDRPIHVIPTGGAHKGVLKPR